MAATLSPAVVDETDGVMPLARVPAPPARRPNTVRVGTYLVIAAGIMLFAGLLGVYEALRDRAVDQGTPWVPEAVTLPNVALAVTYGTLLMSSVTAQWSVASIRMGDRRQMYLALGTTILLGAAFVNGLTFCWSQLGMAAGADDFSNTVYALTVTHLLTVLCALVFFMVMGFRALGGQFSPRDSELVGAAAAFWHFAVLAGLAIWTVVWFLEGGP